MGRYYLMRCIFLVDRNKRHTATKKCNTRMETGRKSDSRSVQIVRFVRTAVRRFPLRRCIFRVDRSCIRVVSLSEYWTCMAFRFEQTVQFEENLDIFHQPMKCQNKLMSRILAYQITAIITAFKRRRAIIASRVLFCADNGLISRLFSPTF